LSKKQQRAVTTLSKCVCIMLHRWQWHLGRDTRSTNGDDLGREIMFAWR